MRILIATLGLALASRAERADDAKANVDVVFAVDRSGSMSGVIETAKRKIWTIVNEIAKTKPTPALRIGLIGYGSGDSDIKLFPLSDDLDKVYADLLTFQCDMGGDEWVGWAIRQGLEKMAWSTEKGALKIIFVVGNETAMQGSADVLYPKTVPEAIRRDVTVNAIYAGEPDGEEERTWREVAKLADGVYTRIDLSGGAITIDTPMDKELMELSGKINATYVPFGKHGEGGTLNQAAQDGNSLANGGSSNGATRALAKSWSGYNCASWDLVDALKAKDFKLEGVKAEDLPAGMRTMSLDEKKAHLARRRAERDALQKRMNELGVARQKFMDAEIKAKNLNQDSAFDEAVRRAIREQAGRKGFTVESE
jgi:hypothetical protein